VRIGVLTAALAPTRGETAEIIVRAAKISGRLRRDLAG
jgi:hypothetical protein